MNSQAGRFRACIFDLDGTLANTLTSIAHFGNATLEEYGLPTIPVETYKTLVGNGADVLMRRMLKAVGAEFPEEKIKEFRASYDRRYESEPMALVEPYSGHSPTAGAAESLGTEGWGTFQQARQHGGVHCTRPLRRSARPGPRTEGGNPHQAGPHRGFKNGRRFSRVPRTGALHWGQRCGHADRPQRGHGPLRRALGIPGKG